MKSLITLVISSMLSAQALQAAQVIVPISDTNTASAIGEVVFTETPYGLLISPNLTGLSAGLHGLHLHQHADCGDHGNNAGSHYDPAQTKTHLGPYGSGHLGDLPVLYVDQNSRGIIPTLAPRLKLADLSGLAVMIHAGGDNYSDTPPLGGGGAREACGAIK